MRIAINCRSILGNNPTGIGRYTQQLIHHLIERDTTSRFDLYARKGLFDRKRHLPSFQAEHVTIKPDYFNLGPKWIVAGCDIYHAPSPDNVTDAPAKVVVTVHDMIYKTFPKSHTSQTIDLTIKNMTSIVKRADKVICISESTRRDLHHYLDLPKTRSCVVYNGVNHDVFHPVDESTLSQGLNWLRTKGLEAKGYLLFVGTLEPRKNLLGILEAMSLLKQKGQLTLKLAVAGMQGWLSDDQVTMVKQLGLVDDVEFLGFVSDSQLAFLYQQANIFLFPSFYEGFGFPILEAMACGCPVISSSNSSCGEIAADAALTIDPHQPSTIKEAIKRIIDDNQLRAQLISRGYARAKQFNFSKTAEETLSIYREVYAQKA